MCYCRFFSVRVPDTETLPPPLCTSAGARFVLAPTGPSVTSEQGGDPTPMTHVGASVPTLLCFFAWPCFHKVNTHYKETKLFVLSPRSMISFAGLRRRLQSSVCSFSHSTVSRFQKTKYQLLTRSFSLKQRDDRMASSLRSWISYQWQQMIIFPLTT